MSIYKISQKIAPVLEKNEETIFAYLFGSEARGETNLESDIDIAVYLDEEKVKDIFKKRLFLIEECQAALKKPTEVVVLNEIRAIFFKFVIIKEGRVIFERDHSKRVDFELKTMQEYYDFQPFLKEYNKAYLERELAEL